MNVLEIKEGVTILHEQEDTIVTVLAPKVEVEVVETEEVEGEEGAEVAAPEEEGEDEGSEESS